MIVNKLIDTCDWASNENALQFLNWAADLHETGIDIAHSQYHKHSAYIIEHADLAGFSKQDQILLASIIRSHRRKFTLTLFNDLPSPWHDYAPYLSIVLRLSVLLHRNRHNDELPDFTLSIIKSKIVMHFPDGWLTQAPLTHADLTQEADYLKSASIKLEFE